MRPYCRLTHSDDIKRVRQEGKSFAHPALVLGFIPNRLDQNRIAVIAGRSVGGAVQRNFAKRRLRSAFQQFQEGLKQGYDLILIARKPILEIPYASLLEGLDSLIRRTELLKDEVN